ncbi:helix-turn-helix domain-containing protein [Bordetella petrii]|nr:helix-turn-helix domain-containing protein [Bordetella petrii]
MDTTLIKGLRLLETLVASEDPRGITELAKELGLMKSNVHRLMKTLEHMGYVRQEDITGRYQCSPKLWELGSRVSSRLELVPIARPVMKALVQHTQETVFLAILDNHEVLYISKEDCPQPVRTYAQIGGRAPLHAVATGKCMLAYLDPDALEQVMARLESTSPNTITDRARLERELQAVRDQGYATNQGEWREGVGSLAAPIFDASQHIYASIGVSGPAHRMTPALAKKFAPAVISAARDISHAFGFSGKIPAA